MNDLHDKHMKADDQEVLERLFELAVLLAEGMDRELAAQGLTRSRAEVIWRLQRGGPATQRELSDALRCTPRNVTGLVDALEAAGLVARNPHPSDRRATVVSLTQQGTKTAAAWQGQYRRLAALLLGDLTTAARTDLATTLDHVLGRLRASTPTPPDQPGSKRRQPTGGRASS